MKSNQFWAAVSKALAVMTVTLIIALMLAPGAWAASTYKILHAFRRSSGGQGPDGNPGFRRGWEPLRHDLRWAARRRALRAAASSSS